MVKALFAGALLLTASTPALAASASMAQVDSSKGEILLELQASGQFKQKADRIETTCTLSGVGTDKALAKVDLDANRAKLLKAMKALGLGAEALVADGLPRENKYPSTLAVVEAVDAAEEAAIDDTIIPPAPISTKPKRVKQTSMEQGQTIRLKSVSQLDALTDVMNANSCESNTYSRKRVKVRLNDRTDAQRKARDAALAKAKAEAETYAAPLGLKVLRIVRVSEVSPIMELVGPEAADLRDEWLEQMWNENRAPSDEVTVNAALWVDVVLGPK